MLRSGDMEEEFLFLQFNLVGCLVAFSRKTRYKEIKSVFSIVTHSPEGNMLRLM